MSNRGCNFKPTHTIVILCNLMDKCGDKRAKITWHIIAIFHGPVGDVSTTKCVDQVFMDNMASSIGSNPLPVTLNHNGHEVWIEAINSEKHTTPDYHRAIKLIANVSSPIGMAFAVQAVGKLWAVHMTVDQAYTQYKYVSMTNNSVHPYEFALVEEPERAGAVILHRTQCKQTSNLWWNHIAQLGSIFV